jgi:hypothetical protein
MTTIWKVQEEEEETATASFGCSKYQRANAHEEHKNEYTHTSREERKEGSEKGESKGEESGQR